MFAVIINKTSGFSQSISGYEVYHHAKAREEKTYKTATIDQCLEISRNDTLKCDYYFFSVKNLYTILDGKIVVDGMLCTVLPFSFSSFDEISLKKDSDSVAFIFNTAFTKTFEEHENVRKSDEDFWFTISIFTVVVIIGLLVIIGFLMCKGKRLSVENLRMNQKAAPTTTICALDNTEEDIFVEYKA